MFAVIGPFNYLIGLIRLYYAITKVDEQGCLDPIQF
jgi:hypothetical protein